jgi:mono/diheme cytochrome c family protein
MTRFAASSSLAAHRALAALACLTALLAGGCEAPGLDDAEATSDAAHAVTAMAPEARIERGRYLVTVAGCNDCHTPFQMGERGPEPDMTRMLSGHPEAIVIAEAPAPAPDSPWIWSGLGTNTAFAGPWGVSFAYNLTPDENTGLGIWTEEMFVQAMRTGKHMGQSRPILPPMPWPGYAQMTDEDLSAVYAYLRSIPAIPNRVPEPLPPAGGPGQDAPAGAGG